MIRKGTALLVVVGAAVAGASAVQAAPPQVCSSFKLSGRTISYETLGHSWSCSSAKKWVVKLAADKVAISDKNIPLKNGPSGYHCFAEPAQTNRAVQGTCFTGTIAFPGTGFAWLPA